VYFLLGISLTLAFLLIVNMAAAILSIATGRLIARPMTFLSVNTQARVIFALRFGPVVAALIFVFAFVVPAYLLHEPEDSGEVVSGKLALIAAASSIAVCIAVYRVLKSCFVTRRLAASWQKNAVEITIPDVDVPVFRIVHPFPVMAVVGIVRPRIFVAEQVLSSLNDDELQAAIAHEYGHLRSRDNLKRTILRVCSDLVVLPLGAGLDRTWAENAEGAADEYAANSRRSAALNLASALIKLARITPRQTNLAMFHGSYLIHGHQCDVTSRVRRLLRLSDSYSKNSPYVVPSWAWSIAATGLLAVHLADQRLLLPTHEAIEHFVWIIR